MRIIHFSHCNLGSAEASTAHVMEFADRLRQRGQKVTVLAPLKGKYQRPTTCKMFYYPFINVKGLRQLSAVISGFIMLLVLHAIYKFDLIYIRRLTLDCFPGIFARLTGVKLIVETNGQIENHEFEVPFHFLWSPVWYPLLRLFERILFSSAFAVTADGDGRLQNFKQRYKDFPQKFHMIRSGGIDLDKFRRVDKEKAKEELHLDQNKRYLVWVGTIFAWSGLEILIAAAEKILPKYPDVDFLIIGEGGERNNFMQMAKEKNVLDRMKFTGYIATAELYKWLSASDVALAPYTRLRLDIEDFTSYKIFEYLACGLPVVCSYESGGSNISYIRKYNLGATTIPEHAGHFTKAIEEVLEDKSFFSEDFETNTRAKLVELQVTWDSLVDQVEKLCFQAIQVNASKIDRLTKQDVNQ